MFWNCISSHTDATTHPLCAFNSSSSLTILLDRRKGEETSTFSDNVWYDSDSRSRISGTEQPSYDQFNLGGIKFCPYGNNLALIESMHPIGCCHVRTAVAGWHVSESDAYFAKGLWMEEVCVAKAESAPRAMKRAAHALLCALLADRSEAASCFPAEPKHSQRVLEDINTVCVSSSGRPWLVFE